MISEILSDYEIILASKSPRRAQLLGELGIHFTIGTKEGVEEVFPEGLSNVEVAKYLSDLKASIYESDVMDTNKLVITSDTIVCLENEILGKPGDKAHAIEMLTKLSGKQHSVITGVTLLDCKKKTTFSVETKVNFKNLSIEEIEFYVDHYKPYDKAGAYGIQEWIGMIGIENIEGSYFNVVGLPVQKLYCELLKF